MSDPIALVDCNNFCASCERLFDPRLRGRPVVVLFNNDVCVIARSNEAKAPPMDDRLKCQTSTATPAEPGAP